jgi:hypothetical protein
MCVTEIGSGDLIHVTPSWVWSCAAFASALSRHSGHMLQVAQWPLDRNASSYISCTSLSYDHRSTAADVHQAQHFNTMLRATKYLLHSRKVL